MRRRNSGMALILVLMLLVLTTIILLAFFLSTQTESKSVRSTVAGYNSQQLASLAVQSVMSQIQQATTHGPTVAWASQPGMIRCYNNSGQALAWYKLYSATNMIVNNPSESLALITNDVPSGAWATAGSPNYGVYTDINSPVVSLDKTLTYPILNPSGATSVAAAAGTSPVIGFDIATSSTPGYTAPSSGPVTSNASATNNPAAMPVRWIYILRDGTQVPAVASGTAGTVTVNGASSSNPIIGRIAYWTDDETCKVNVNTAADGTYFDPPRFDSATNITEPSMAILATTPYPSDPQDVTAIGDRQMGVTPPVSNEYQRYIGHPAQTKLSFALNMLPGISSLNGIQRSNLFSDITPFLQWGGSLGGTQPFSSTSTGTITMLPPTRQTPYATLDEWMFNTQLNGTTRWVNPGPSQGTNPNSMGANPPLTSPLITNSALQQLRFFISANSDAPEVNLFGQPRVSIWPISSDILTASGTVNTTSNYTTYYDRMIANAAMLSPITTGTTTPVVPYFFTRTNAGSTTIDWAGQSPGSVMGTSTQTRNQALFAYLRKFASTPIPGYGGTFGASYPYTSTLGTSANKYGTPEMDQILTEIFDYIRSTNPYDVLLPNNYTYGATAVSNTGVSPSPYEQASLYSTTAPYTTDYSIFGPAAQVVPISLSLPDSTGSYTTKGFGRFYTVSDVVLDFCKVAPPDPVTGNVPVMGSIFLGLFCPSEGYANIDPHMRIVVQDYHPGTMGISANPGTISMTLNAVGTGTTTSYNVFGSPNNGYSGTPSNATRTAFSTVTQLVPNSLSGAIGWADTGYGPLEWGGYAGTRPLAVHRIHPYYITTGTANPTTTTYTMTPEAGGQNLYQLTGPPMMISPTGTLTLNNGATEQLEILVYFSNSSFTSTTYGDGLPGLPADLVQDIVVNVPPFKNFPLPTDGMSGTYTSGTFDTIMRNIEESKNTASNETVIYEGDLAQSLNSGYNGDSRLIAAQRVLNDAITVPTVSSVPTGTTTPTVPVYPATGPVVYNAFVPHQYYGLKSMAYYLPDMFHGDGELEGDGFSLPAKGVLVPSASPVSNFMSGPIQFNATGSLTPSSPRISGSPDFTGDWDNGPGYYPDGPFINKADESGSQYTANSYYSNTATTPLVIYDTPNRTLASPVMFGSLSTGVPLTDSSNNLLASAYPWQTLLFRPQPANAATGMPAHPGSANSDANWPTSGVEDELLLDWFWMPVAEPYAISTTLATAGKVNMNYQIAPFTYITRATALMSVLASENVIAVPTASSSLYKNGFQAGGYPTYRSPVKVLKTDNVTLDDDDGTLRQFKDHFNNGFIYKSAAEICDIFLEPTTDPTSGAAISWGKAGTAIGVGTSDSSYINAAQAFWAKNQLTGDNSRERPYNGLYPRLTTKSNTYTIHVRAQALAAPVNGAANTWVENPQLITSEYRGSVTINRYLDPEDPNIPDFAAPANLLQYSIDNYYKYRVLETRRFLP